MLDVLQFVFSSFWTWAGTLILILAFACWRPVTIVKKEDE